MQHLKAVKGQPIFLTIANKLDDHLTHDSLTRKGVDVSGA